MSAFLKNFVRQDDGATMVEYGLMLAFIALVCISAVIEFGLAVGSLFDITGQ